MRIVYTRHAQEMMVVRGISTRLVEACIRKPDKTMPGRNGKLIYLKDSGQNYLKVVAVQEGPNVFIVTLHWLEKIRAK